MFSEGEFEGNTLFGTPTQYHTPYFWAQILNPATKNFSTSPFYAWQEMQILQDPNNPGNFLLQVLSGGRTGTLNSDGTVSNPAMEASGSKQVPYHAIVQMQELGFAIQDPESANSNGSSTYIFQYSGVTSNISLATLKATLHPNDSTAQIQLPTSSSIVLADNKFFDQGSYNDTILVVSNPAGSTNPWLIMRVQPQTVLVPGDDAAPQTGGTAGIGYDPTVGAWTKQTKLIYVQGPAAPSSAIIQYVPCQSVSSNLQQDNTTITLSLSGAINAGSNETMTATVSHSSGSTNPTGNVTYWNGSIYLGSAALGSGTAALTLANLPVGSLTIVAQYEGDQYYNGSMSSGQNVTVSKASTSIAAPSITPSPVTYGTSVSVSFSLTKPAAVNATGAFTLYDGSTAIATTLNSPFSGIILNAGSHTITVKYDVAGADSNLNGCTSSSTALTVSKAPLTLTAISASMTYGASVPTLVGVLSGFVLSDTAASILGQTGTLSLTTTATNTTGIGSYTITAASGSWASTNYTIGSYVNGTLVINTASLVIQANNAAKTQGNAMPGLTCSVGGIMNGDNVSGVATAMANQYSPAGSYSITAAAAGSGSPYANYSITLISGTLIVYAP